MTTDARTARLAAIGEHCVQYYLDTRDCRLCDAYDEHGHDEDCMVGTFLRDFQSAPTDPCPAPDCDDGSNDVIGGLPTPPRVEVIATKADADRVFGEGHDEWIDDALAHAASLPGPLLIQLSPGPGAMVGPSRGKTSEDADELAPAVKP